MLPGFGRVAVMGGSGFSPCGFPALFKPAALRLRLLVMNPFDLFFAGFCRIESPSSGND
jgi:hypothetical protein